MGKGKKKMAKPSFEILEPQHGEYVANFRGLAASLDYPESDRDTVMQQVDHLLDKHALDYPEIVIGYQLTRLEVEVVGMLV